MVKLTLYAILFFVIISCIDGENDCGKIQVRKSTPLIGSKQSAYHGQFPWLAPLFHSRKYICGSSIISQWHLLTAASCIDDKTANKYHTLVGRFNLSDESEFYWKRKNISAIYAHEDFNIDAEVQRSDGDIAILRVTEKINYSKYIQPICLPEESTNAANRYGMTAMYRKTENYGDHQTIPNYVTLKSIGASKCSQKSQIYANLVANRSFCADDSTNDTSITCQGDCGGAFVVHNRMTDQYIVLGIVSFSIGRCNPKDYVAFADVTQYIDWINETIEFDKLHYDESSDPCESVYCGDKGECQIFNGKTKCVCLPQYSGTYPQCEPPCMIHSECLDDRVCVHRICTDLCLISSPCVENAQCEMKNHRSSCECIKGYDGDGYNQCIKGFTNDPECGTVKAKKATALSFNGTFSYPGQFPWFASIFQYSRNRYLCGSTIITQWHLLTSAHCMVSDAKDLYALLGRYNLSDDTEIYWIQRNFSQSFIHEDFNENAERQLSNGDIAILKVSEKIEYSDYIRPICLPGSLTNVENVHGFFPGYGITEPLQARNEDTPSYVILKHIEKWKCLDKGNHYLNVISDRSFCADNEYAITCQGDSGGGFYFYDRTTRQYSIYGILTHGVSHCDPDEYAIFIDVTKYISWIQEKIEID